MPAPKPEPEPEPELKSEPALEPVPHAPVDSLHLCSRTQGYTYMYIHTVRKYTNQEHDSCPCMHLWPRCTGTGTYRYVVLYW